MPRLGLYELAAIAACLPLASALVLEIALTLAVWLIWPFWRAAQWALDRRPPWKRLPGAPTRRGPVRRARPPRHRADGPNLRKADVDEYCACGHTAAEHLNSTQRCRAEDENGDRCPCTVFEDAPEAEED